jgi:hypothetical protein
MLDKEWFSAAELAALALPGVPSTKRGVQLLADAERWNRSDYKGKHWRMRQGRGGGVEYHYTLLPTAAQAKLTIDFMQAEEAGERQVKKAALTRDEMAARFERLPQKHKDQAQHRLTAVTAVEELVLRGVGKVVARMQVAKQMDIAVASICNWEKLVENVAAADRRYYLASYYAGRTDTVECSPEAWEWLKTSYLRLEPVTFQQCYDDLVEIAPREGWTIPSQRTLQRRMDALPEALRVLCRSGVEALKRMYPAQERDYSVLHAMEAVNADGHKIDTFVRWPGLPNPIRPMLCVFQDLYSGKILSWRADVSANKESVRLAFGDMVEAYGVPDDCYLDNGRDFASKWLTGGTPNRYRFKIKDEDPAGILVSLGVKVHWTTPYHGQSKRIERAFRDFADRIAKDIRFAGAYVGKNTTEKPENYGSHAVPLDLFVKVVSERIAQHNAKTGREAKTAEGRSFDETFAESYEKSPIKKATAEQRRLWLLAAESNRASKTDGSLTLLDNRYWAEFLHEHRGQKLVIRFDPQSLHQPLFVYRLDGSFLGAAPCVEMTGFNDRGQARVHAQNLGAFMKAKKAMRAAEISMSLTEAAALLPQAEEPPPPLETKVVRLITRGATAVKPIEEEEEEQDLVSRALLQAVRAGRPNHLRAVTDDD